MLELYKYVPSPLVLHNLTLSTHPTKDLLAINQERTMYKELGETDLTECLRYGRKYHCQFQNVLSKNVRTSCLFVLFSRNLGLVEQTCNMHVDNIQKTAVQLSPHQFRLTSPDEE
ncbi:Hypothetical predicted protein, partial [Paramuricea clavata]